MNPFFYRKLAFYFLLSMTGKGIFTLSTSIGQIITKEPTASANALSGGGVSVNNGADSYLTNPALLAESEYIQAFTTFRQGLFDNNLGVLGATYRYESYVFGFSIFGLLPQKFSEVNDTGNTVDTYTYSEVATGIHASSKFKMAGRDIYWGAGPKLFYTTLLGQSVYSILGDAGLIIPLTISSLKIMPNSPTQNFRLGLALQNLGSPINFDSGKGYIESAFISSINWYFLESRLNQTNLFINLKYQIYDVGSIDRFIPSVGIQHGFLNFIYLRTSAFREAERFGFALGMGTRYVYNNLYILQFDYAIQPYTGVGDIHTFSLKGAYTFANFGEKVRKHNESQEISEKMISEELIKTLQKGVNEYALYNRKFPSSLSETLPILQKEYGLKSIPEPTNGTILYDPKSGIVQIVSKELQEFKDRIYLNDGSSLLCNIEKETSNNIQVKHRFGSMLIDKNSILRIESIRLNALDAEIIKTVQAYVHDFRSRSGRFPRTLIELEENLKKKNIDRLPVPSTGTLELDQSTGNVYIQKNKGGISATSDNSAENKEKPGVDYAPKKDVFDF